MRPGRRIAMTVVALCLLIPAAAEADFGSLYNDYAADGAITGCRYSSAELRAGLGEIPADVRQYDPGFELALESALEQRLNGCVAGGKLPASGGATRTTADGSPGPRTVAAAHVPSIHKGRGVPAIVVAMIILLGGVLVVAAILGLAAYFGWDLAALAPTRIAGARFGERVSDRLYAVRDRLGF